ncbi:MAG: ABC transporter substrate-binding protein [Spirochaetaceae bacterium]|nr:MAG: ABC transporter substrate-binding protein [Spirochaetaceae bacterium]
MTNEKTRACYRPEPRSRTYHKQVIAILALLVWLSASSFAQEAFTISNSYQNLLSNAEGTGTLDRIFTEVFRRNGMEVLIVYSPTERSLPDVNAGVFDAEANRISGMEEQYPNLRRVPEPNMVMEFVAFSKRPIEINGWESLRNLDIGVVRGWKILEDNISGFPNVARVPTEKELFNMLRLDRIDVALYSKLTGYALLQEMEIEGITHLTPPLATREMYLYVHAKHDGLRESLASALREIKADGTYAAIISDVLAQHNIILE